MIRSYLVLIIIINLDLDVL